MHRNGRDAPKPAIPVRTTRRAEGGWVYGTRGWLLDLQIRCGIDVPPVLSWSGARGKSRLCRNREEKGMENLTRRSVLRGSAALAATGALARPHIANAAATTASVWWNQGFIQSEDVAFQNLAAA